MSSRKEIFSITDCETFSWSSIHSYIQCPALYEWTYVKKIVPKIKSRALSAGYAISRALEHYRKTGNAIESAEALILACSEDHSDLVGKKIDDPRRSVERLAEIFVAYCAEYPNEDQNVIQPETPFEIFISEEKRIVFRGIIDALIELNDGTPALIEDKTTSKLGDTFFKYHKDSPQVMWYLNVADHLGLFQKAMPKCIINAIYIHPTTLRFERDISIKPRRVIERSYKDLLDWISQIMSAKALSFFPRNLTFCHEYGGCPYLPLRDMEEGSSLYQRVLEANFISSEEEENCDGPVD